MISTEHTHKLTSEQIINQLSKLINQKGRRRVGEREENLLGWKWWDIYIKVRLGKNNKFSDNKYEGRKVRYRKTIEIK